MVIDADLLAREVVAPGTDGLAEVVAAFGPGVLTDDGALDRPALGAIVFADPDRRRTLEAIIHPAGARPGGRARGRGARRARSSSTTSRCSPRPGRRRRSTR